MKGPSLKTRVRVLVVLCLLLAGTAVALRSWLSPKAGTAEASGTQATVRVHKARFVASLFVSGELAASQAIRIGAPPFRGRGPFAIKALAPEGSHVEPGELLVQIDNSTLLNTLLTEELNLEKAENDLAKTQAQLEIQMQDLEIQLGQTRLELEKAALKAEIERDLLSLRDWQDYQFAFQKAKKEYDKTIASRELVQKAAREEIGVLKLKRDQLAERIARLRADVAAMDIRADRRGTVLYEIFPPSRWQGDAPRKLQAGDQIFQGWTILSLPDLKEMEVRAFVSEVDGGLVRPGQRARIVTDSHPDIEFGGTVEHVPELAEIAGKARNVRVFNATIKLDRTDTTLMRPGMSVRAEIILSEQDGLVLPRAAVVEEDGRFYVKTVRSGVKAEVQLRGRNAVWCLIEGFADGTEVML